MSERYNLLHGDCLDELKGLADNSVDSIVTDPPYHLQSIVSRFKKTSTNDNNKTGERAKTRADAYARTAVGFMGQEWDGGDIAFKLDVWIECLRVLKPGGHLLAFGGTRTYHRMVVAIEDAGFEIRDQIGWLYGTGFPKSHNIATQIDNQLGVEPKIVGKRKHPTLKDVTKIEEQANASHGNNFWKREWDMKESSSKESEPWRGWGTALKPAWEPIVLARKPIEEKTVAENVLKHGAGGINIDECRVKYISDDDMNVGGRNKPTTSEKTMYGRNSYTDSSTKAFHSPANNKGRWPANIIHDGSDEVLDEFAKYGEKKTTYISNHHQNNRSGAFLGELDHPGEQGYNDNGTAARFFYSAKASKEDREFGNDHPTVKPNSLMRYLCKLITPPNGIVLDPFMGSGSTGKAALQEGFRFVGIEREDKYFKIAEKKVASGLPTTNSLFDD